MLRSRLCEGPGAGTGLGFSVTPMVTSTLSILCGILQSPMVPSPQGSLEKGVILETSLWTPAESRWEKKQEFSPNRVPLVGGHWATGDRETALRSSPPAVEKSFCPQHRLFTESAQRDRLARCFQGRTVTAVTGDWGPSLLTGGWDGVGGRRDPRLRKPFSLGAFLAGHILRKFSKGWWPVDSAQHLTAGWAGGISWPRGGRGSTRWFPAPRSFVAGEGQELRAARLCGRQSFPERHDAALLWVSFYGEYAHWDDSLREGRNVLQELSLCFSRFSFPSSLLAGLPVAPGDRPSPSGVPTPHTARRPRPNGLFSPASPSGQLPNECLDKLGTFILLS